MTCKWNGLFNVGEDFNDEDLLEMDWSAPSVSASTVSSAAQSCFLRSTAASTPAAPYGQNNSHQPSTEGILAHRGLSNGPGSENSTPNSVGQSPTLGLRQLSTSKPLPSFPLPPRHLPTLSRGLCTVTQQSSSPAQQMKSNTTGQQEAPSPQDDFDDWDVDLADLDESDPQMRTWAQVRETAPAADLTKPSDDSVSPAKRLRPTACGGAQTGPNVGLRGFSTSNQMSGLPSSSSILHRSSFPGPFPSPRPDPSGTFLLAPPQSPVFPGLTMASCPFPRPVTPRPVKGLPSQVQRPWATPLAQGRSLFDPISPAPSSRFGGPISSPSLTPRSLHTPVFTNHLIQLVSNSNKTPQRPGSDHIRPNTRRFPGPAGILPQQQLHGQSLDDIVVAIPQTPAHGAVARLPSQVPSSQTEEEDFSGGPWAAMKAEMGLDERNSSCFLHSYSVAMVLRKAALKQLVKNKVPNMAVVLKSILHTHADAKAVFRDRTGEMQGTVHRRLLEDRLGELKTGVVLLLKQVGVFSPSHRNHYLNVTPNNLLRIYPPDGSTPSSTQSQLLPLPPEPMLESSDHSSSVPGAPVSQMELFYDNDDEEDVRAPQVTADSGAGSSSVPQGPPAAPLDLSWDADDLDELLGELPVESYCL
ncbi:uncharacterized protein C17orf53 homolog isoform X3 [Oncorhynchus kisutch]|uniref:Homologous recombination OB-fold protein OB-fold domain-containing protein n=1 Tax=Oncorhynchus kisutch TaxID=8019 RepID=A0A8C7ILF0_ONCKI|nr:uncharacterized protein C17orf53 homolog isoform X3 [Oncorhynchus kisutch]